MFLKVPEPDILTAVTLYHNADYDIKGPHKVHLRQLILECLLPEGIHTLECNEDATLNVMWQEICGKKGPLPDDLEAQVQEACNNLLFDR